jgi:hypothetical protein
MPGVNGRSFALLACVRVRRFLRDGPRAQRFRGAKLGLASSLPPQALDALFQDSAMCKDSAIVRARRVEVCEAREDFSAREMPAALTKKPPVDK